MRRLVSSSRSRRSWLWRRAVRNPLPDRRQLLLRKRVKTVPQEAAKVAPAPTQEALRETASPYDSMPAVTFNRTHYFIIDKYYVAYMLVVENVDGRNAARASVGSKS